MIQCLRNLGLALILLVSTVGVYAQDTGDVPVIGVLRASSATQHDPAMEAIRAKLSALGYAEGRNIRIEQRFANRRVERLPQLADELVRMNVKAIIAVNEASLRAAKQATSTIPIIVVAYDHDPVASGLIGSTNRPDGSAWIMWAWVRSWPLMAKLPFGALIALVGPIFPSSVLTSVASPGLPSSRTGSTATEPPK